MSRLILLLSVSLVSAFAADQTCIGQISDSMCGADRSAMAKQGKKADPHECTLMCTKGGGKYVFVSEDKVLDISNQDFADLSAHAGHEVKLTGDLDSAGKAVTVSKIDMNH